MDSSTSGGFLISLDSFSALTFSPLALPLSLAGFVREGGEDEGAGEVLGRRLVARLLFFCFLALGLGRSAVAGLLLEDLGGVVVGARPWGHALQFGLLQGHLGLLECSLGRAGPSLLLGWPALAQLPRRVLGTPGLPTPALRLLGGARLSEVLAWPLPVLLGCLVGLAGFAALLAGVLQGRAGRGPRSRSISGLPCSASPTATSIIHLIQAQLRKSSTALKK